MAWNIIGQLAGGAGSGATWTTGHGAPVTPGVNPGDMYLDVDTGNVYRWNGASWVLSGNIEGPTGPTGAAGSTGPPGATGATGATGGQGATGDAGRPNIGPVGPRGNDGNKWLIGTNAPQPSDGVVGDLFFQTTALTTGPILLKGDPGPPGIEGPAGPPGQQQTNLGFALFVPMTGVKWSADANSADNGFAISCVVNVPAPMWLYGLGVDVNTGAAGTVQWGLFDYTQSATAARKVAGNTGTLATGYSTIAAAGGPIFVPAGSYVLIYLCAAASTPTINKCNVDFATTPMQKSQGSYVWSDTPNLTSGWGNDGTLYIMALHGQLSASAGKY